MKIDSEKLKRAIRREMRGGEKLILKHWGDKSGTAFYESGKNVGRGSVLAIISRLEKAQGRKEGR